MRRLVTFLAIAASTAAASIYWLYNGDLDQASTLIDPMLSTWNAESLADEAGIPDDEPSQ